MKDALIIFVRNAEPGKVKTRLAATVGNNEAVRIYKLLLEHTKLVTVSLPCDKYVYYADDINHDDLWESSMYDKRLQPHGDLGERMQQAFDEIFTMNYEKVCIIGSDCITLTTEILQSAFSNLERTDVVIGPSEDGGYYLIGMKKSCDHIFINKDWSTEKLFAQTTEAITNADQSHILLPVLSDIDTEEDWKKYQQTIN